MSSLEPVDDRIGPGAARTRFGRLEHIDALRAASVVMIILMHAGFGEVPGDGAVSIFFVISGYIITTVLIRERRRSGSFDVRGFYWRRILKLAPPFIVIIAVPTLIYSVVRDISWWAFATQVFFSYNWLEVASPDAADHVLPGSAVVWTLAVEEQFYIGFAVLWFFWVRWRLSLGMLGFVAAAAAVASCVIRVVLAAMGGSYEHLYRGTDTRLEAIAVGVTIAILLDFHLQGRIPQLARFGGAWALWAAFTLLLLPSIIFRDSFTEPAFRPTAHAWGAALAILFGTLATGGVVADTYRRIAGLRLIQLVGVASYSIYLVHDLLIYCLRGSVGDLPDGLFVGLAVAASLSVGIGLYYAVEVPAMRLRKPAWARGDVRVPL
jgi:peptidoglycan/LPS O-acetylase OafA/YrhL